jgi:hypothetical protein
VVVLALRRKSKQPPPIVVGSTSIDASTSIALAELEHAKIAVSNLRSHDGQVVDAVTSSDICSTVMGYVDKLVQFGDVISEVHLSQFPFSSFLSHFRSTLMQSSHGRRSRSSTRLV